MKLPLISTISYALSSLESKTIIEKNFGREILDENMQWLGMPLLLFEMVVQPVASLGILRLKIPTRGRVPT